MPRRRLWIGGVNARKTILLEQNGVANRIVRRMCHWCAWLFVVADVRGAFVYYSLWFEAAMRTAFGNACAT